MKYACRYLPISEDTQNQGLYVIAGGYTHIDANTIYPPTFHPTGYQFDADKGRILQEYQVVYIAKGKGDFRTTASGRHRIVAGSMFILFPGEWHTYKPDISTGWHEYWLALRGRDVHSLLQSYGITRSNPIMEIGVHEGIVSDYTQLVEELLSESVGYTHIAASFAQLILARASAYSQRLSLAYSPLHINIEQARSQLLTNYTQPFDFEEYCRTTGMSYHNFRREFKRITGFSPSRYQMQLKINEACRLLQYTHLSVGDISARLGFESIFYFSRLFKQKTGVSPLNYRSQTLPHLAANNSNTED